MNRRVVMFAVLAAVAMLGLWYLLLFSPANSDLDSAKKRADDARTRQASLQADITRLKEAQASEPQIRAKLETLRAAIPDDPGLGQFILDVNDAATRSGIEFVSISPGLPTQAKATAGATTATTAGTTGATTGTTLPGTVVTPTAPAPAEITLTIQIKGGYYQVLDFLNRVNTLPRLVVTDGLNITADATGGLTVAITGRMFVRTIPPGFAGAVATTSTTAAGGSTTTTAPGGSTTSTTVRP